MNHLSTRPSDIFSAIIHGYNALTKSETKVADFVLLHKQQVHLLSISELASACAVSEATISRFCHRVGCASFNEFKLATVQSEAAAELPESSSNLYDTVLPSDTIEQKCRKLCYISSETLLHTLHHLDTHQISRAVDLLSGARNVFCFGQGSSCIIAEDAWGRFCGVSPKFHCIANANLQAGTAALLTEEDVVLYFSFSGSVRELTEMGAILRRGNVKLILVTRDPDAPGAAFADVVLVCGADKAPEQQASIAVKISQLFIVDILFHEYCARNRIAMP